MKVSEWSDCKREYRVMDAQIGWESEPHGEKEGFSAGKEYPNVLTYLAAWEDESSCSLWSRRRHGSEV
jgi:hypothetical protein